MSFDAQRWEDITRRVEESAKAQQETAVILERLKGQLDTHDARISRLENASEKTSERVTQQRIELDSRLIGWLVAALVAVYTLLSNHIIFR